MNHRRVSTLCGRFALRCSVFCFRQPTGMTAWSSTRESHAHLIHAHQQYQLSMSLDAANQSQQIFEFVEFWGVCKSSLPRTWCALYRVCGIKGFRDCCNRQQILGASVTPFIGLSRSDVLQVWALQVFDYRIFTACCSCLEKDRCKDVVLVSCVLDQ